MGTARILADRSPQARGPALNLNEPKRFTELSLDHVFTDLDLSATSPSEVLCQRGQVTQLPDRLSLQLWTSPSFRELVIFTPPHRQAICLEPYTCVTDAVHLQQEGLNAGWQVLEPGEHWQGLIELRLTS